MSQKVFYDLGKKATEEIDRELEEFRGEVKETKEFLEFCLDGYLQKKDKRARRKLVKRKGGAK